MKYVSVYISDEDEEIIRQVKELCRKLNISFSALVRQFFRALAQQRDNFKIDTTINQIVIGGINIINNNNATINITNIKVALYEAIELLKTAVSTQHIQKKTAFERQALDVLKKIASSL